MSQWSDAFSELVRLVQPDVDPVLTKGGGSSADPTKELDQILAASARGVQWSASLAVTYGQVVFPTVRNGRKYRVAAAGTMEATEPSWPDYDFASLTSGNATLVEDGQDFGSIYDVRRAAYAALDLKTQRAANQNQYIQDGRGQASSYLYLNLVRERDKFISIGVA